VLLAITPFPLLLLQAYGGELLLRIYLFSVPFMVFFGAALFFPSPRSGNSPRTTSAILVVSVLLLGGFLFTRYGNERMMYFAPNEVDAVRYLYETAEPGSQFVAASGTLPWRFQDYRTYKYTTAEHYAKHADISGIIGIMSDKKYPASYLILTRSQQAAGELFIGWSPGTWEKFEAGIRDSGKFTPVYTSDTANVYVLSSLCEKKGIGQRICSSPLHR
jgi:hypothetical protein